MNQDTLTLLMPVVVIHAVVLVAVIFVIRRLLLSDTLRAVEKVKEAETEVRRREEGIRKEIEEHEREFTRKKADAEDEMQKQKKVAEKELTQLRDEITADAKEEAERIMEQARRNESKFREQIAQDMEKKAVEYGGQVFSLVFSEKTGLEVNKQFTGELLDALEDIDATSITVDATDVDFVSSHPMDPDQKARLEQLLAEKFGVNVKIRERIQEDLMAGLILKLGSLEIDGSLRNRCEEALVEVKKEAKV